jgi:adenylate kinase
LLEKIAVEQGHHIIVVKIDLPRDLLFRRLTGRLTCSHCGAIYHIEFKPPRREGICDLHDYPLFTRSDDNKEAIQQRLALFDEKTRPLLAYYAETNRLHRVDGTGTPEEVFERLSAIFARATGLKVERQAATDE